MFRSTDEIFRSLTAPRADGRPALPETTAREIAALARPGIAIETRKVGCEAEIPLGATKIGGRPDLPKGSPWPCREPYPDAAGRAAWNLEQAAIPDAAWRWATAEQCEGFRRDFAQMADVVRRRFPLQFVAQINLAQARAAGLVDGEFPKAGLLSIFFDAAELPAGDLAADQVGTQVILHEDDPATLSRVDVPEELIKLERYLPIAPLACAKKQMWNPLPPESRTFDRLALSASLIDRYSDWWMQVHEEAEDEGRAGFLHRIGGWPMAIQNDMPTELALLEAGYDLSDPAVYSARETALVRVGADAWGLLAQIGSDEKNGLMWGDSGMLYVWIRREDLAAGRFDKCRGIVQCH